MSPEISRLLAEIDAYCAARGIRPTTLGRYAMNEGKFYERLKGGREVLPRTAEKVRRYIAEHPPASSAAAPGAAARDAA